MDIGNYAAYTALSGLAAMSGILAAIGMERVISRYVPEARLSRSVDELGRFIWRTVVIRLLAAVIVTLLLAVCWPSVNRFLAVNDFEYFSPVLACLIISEALFQHLSAILQALVMQKTLTRLLVIQWAGRILLITLFVLWKGNLDWQDSLWIFAIPELLGAIALLSAIRHYLHNLHIENYPNLSRDPWPQWNKVADVGLHNYGFTLMAAPPQGYFMKVLAAAFLPAEVVAAYGFFISLSEKVRQYIPMHFFYGMLEPIMVANYLKERDFSALSFRCQLLYKSNLLLMVPIIVWVAVAGNSTVALLTGGKFQGLSWILVLVTTQLTIGSHITLLQLILNSIEKSKVLLQASFTALPIMLLGLWISIETYPKMLIFCPIIFSLSMNIRIIHKLAQNDFHYRPSWKMVGSSIFSGFISFTLASLATQLLSREKNLVFTSTITFVIVILAYCISLYLFKAISKTEINIARSLIRRKSIN